MNLDLAVAVHDHAARTPDAVALDCDGEVVTYSELDRWSAELAWHLVDRGVRPGDAVAIRAADHNGHVAAALAAWRVRAWFVVVQESLPLARSQDLVDRTGIRVSLVTPGLTPLAGTRVVGLDRGSHGEMRIPDDELLVPSAEPDLIAYGCFTSGSTGSPKGVLVDRRALTSFAASAAALFGLGPEPFFSGAEDMWDGAIISTWPSLLTGGSSVSTADTRDPFAIRERIRRTGATRAFFGTALGELLLESQDIPEGVRDLVLGGDVLRRRPGRDASFRLWNAYGPTEATCAATLGVVAHDADPVTIGTPLTGSHVEIVDSELRLVPAGARGQLTIQGRLAIGYLGQPGKTAEVFVPAPGGERRYLTGDSARELETGLEFLGRSDRQVSVRGRRVELDGVTQALRAVTGTTDVQVALVGDGLDVRLVAFVQGEDQDAVVIRSRLAEALPTAERPDQVFVVERLPTSDAQVQALVRPSGEQPGAERAPAADAVGMDPVDEIVVEVWARRMAGREPRLDDDFFAAGGSSLRAIQIVQELQEAFGVTLPLQRFLAEPTPAVLARILREKLVEQLDSLSDDELRVLSEEA